MVASCDVLNKMLEPGRPNSYAVVAEALTSQPRRGPSANCDRSRHSCTNAPPNSCRKHRPRSEGRRTPIHATTTRQGRSSDWARRLASLLPAPASAQTNDLAHGATETS